MSAFYFDCTLKWSFFCIKYMIKVNVTCFFYLPNMLPDNLKLRLYFTLLIYRATLLHRKYVISKEFKKTGSYVSMTLNSVAWEYQWEEKGEYSEVASK